MVIFSSSCVYICIQAHRSLNQIHTWFLENAFVHDASMQVCVMAIFSQTSLWKYGN